jgi:hypothetical protein
MKYIRKKSYTLLDTLDYINNRITKVSRSKNLDDKNWWKTSIFHTKLYKWYSSCNL